MGSRTSLLVDEQVQKCYSLLKDTGYGISVPTTTPASYTSSTSYEYLCLNTEMTQSENVTAIEFYMSVAGYVSLKVR